jgi:hypothetical protein
MGSEGMAMMGSMEHALPDNTLPMMTGFGQFGPIEMGGMFTVVKIREGLARDDYTDPGPYQHPPGTVAYEIKGSAAEPVGRSDKSATGGPAAAVKVVKPGRGTSSSSSHQH